MAAKTVRNGRGHSNLEMALTVLIQNQAKFVSEMADINRRSNELKEETAKRFSNIENLLLQHNQLLKALPDTLKEKIGFQKS